MVQAARMRDSKRMIAAARRVGAAALSALLIATLFGAAPSRAAVPCINVFHDESQEAGQRGPMNAIMLANLLGHWPQYEVRVRPIEDYRSDALAACKATLYLGTLLDAAIPEAFLADYFTTRQRIAWIGFGVDKLDPAKLALAFHHRVAGLVTIDDRKAAKPRFYQHVAYKGSVFHKDVQTSGGHHQGAFEAVHFRASDANAEATVLARLVHNTTRASIPYFLRSDNRFLVGDIPFAYVNEADRYFAFADLLFDILDEQPRRASPLALVRIEDVHPMLALDLLRATADALRAQAVPVTIAHIPLFMDPLGAYGARPTTAAIPAYDVPDFAALIAALVEDRRSGIVWHGTTHQFGLAKNPYSGTTGDDYEFWDAVAQRPVPGDGPALVLERLAQGLTVFEHYPLAPRYWETPHYQASALDNRIFGAIFPWVVGAVTYYTSSFGPAFTLPAVSAEGAALKPSVDRQLLEECRHQDWGEFDTQSLGGQSQMFPFEIYRDVYGQRVIPETLGYLSFASSDQTEFVRTPRQMLADARRNLVVRDYWASFFVHTHLFASRAEGGVGRRHGDTAELSKLLAGLKALGYRFVGLREFEASLAPGVDMHASSAR
jgi:uncharacterized protein YdaL